MAARGRPSKFTQRIADKICDQIAHGKSLRTICKATAMPSAMSVNRWLRDEKNEDFRLQYARAREEQTEFYVDEMVGIADSEKDANRARVRIDTRKWVASKLKPKKYGDKIQNEVSGQVNITITPDDAAL